MVAEENIPEIILKDTAELIIVCRIKIRVRTGYIEPTVVGTNFNSSFYEYVPLQMEQNRDSLEGYKRTKKWASLNIASDPFRRLRQFLL